jgi:hypothetical protein
VSAAAFAGKDENRSGGVASAWVFGVEVAAPATVGSPANNTVTSIVGAKVFGKDFDNIDFNKIDHLSILEWLDNRPDHCFISLAALSNYISGPIVTFYEQRTARML